MCTVCNITQHHSLNCEGSVALLVTHLFGPSCRVHSEKWLYWQHTICFALAAPICKRLSIPMNIFVQYIWKHKLLSKITDSKHQHMVHTLWEKDQSKFCLNTFFSSWTFNVLSRPKISKFHFWNQWKKQQLKNFLCQKTRQDPLIPGSRRNMKKREKKWGWQAHCDYLTYMLKIKCESVHNEEILLTKGQSNIGNKNDDSSSNQICLPSVIQSCNNKHPYYSKCMWSRSWKCLHSPPMH